MVITHCDAFCVKIQSGERVLVFNPPSKKSAFKTPRFQADVVLISQDHADFNGHENITGNPFLVDGPGEYEVQGITIAGISSVPTGNTIYRLEFDNINFCHMGAFDGKELQPEAREKLGDIDILFVSVKIPMNIINQIEPKIVMPLCIDKKDLASFLKKAGGEKVKPLEKFSFKKKDIEGKKEEIVVLE